MGGPKDELTGIWSMSEPQLFKVKEYATLATVSESTVRRWLKEGLPHFQPRGRGSMVLIPAGALEKFEAAKKNLASPSTRAVDTSVAMTRLSGQMPAWMRARAEQSASRPPESESYGKT